MVVLVFLAGRPAPSEALERKLREYVREVRIGQVVNREVGQDSSPGAHRINDHILHPQFQDVWPVVVPFHHEVDELGAPFDFQMQPLVQVQLLESAPMLHKFGPAFLGMAV
jgi:hypothetical protein